MELTSNSEKSFNMPKKDKQNQKFELACNSWKTLTIPITIYWSRASGLKSQLKLEHEISFREGGDWKAIKV